MTDQKSTTTPSKNQLVKISESQINGDIVNSVDARELHSFLNVKTAFSDWIKRRIVEYNFVNDSDYLTISNRNYTGIGNAPIDYIISIDMAKELSMVEKNSKGKEARKYFIECEKQAKNPIEQKPRLSTKVDDLKATIEMANIFGLKGNQALLSANTAIKKIHNFDCMATLGITHLIPEKQIQYFTPSVLGKKKGLSAQKLNKALEIAGFQAAVRDHRNRVSWEVTDAGKEYCQLLDTSKSHSDGTPIMQVKWSSSVLDIVAG